MGLCSLGTSSPLPYNTGSEASWFAPSFNGCGGHGFSEGVSSTQHCVGGVVLAEHAFMGEDAAEGSVEMDFLYVQRKSHLLELRMAEPC